VTEGLDGANPAARPVALRTPTPDVAAAHQAAQARQRAQHANNAVLVVVAVAAGVLLVAGLASLGRRRAGHLRR
jgi:hypothetical protein